MKNVQKELRTLEQKPDVMKKEKVTQEIGAVSFLGKQEKYRDEKSLWKLQKIIATAEVGKIKNLQWFRLKINWSWWSLLDKLKLEYDQPKHLGFADSEVSKLYICAISLI